MSHKLTFNGNLLIPSGIISCDIQTFEQTFLTLPNTKRREDIYEQYQKYLADLKNTLKGVEFTHWINGSFVTQKIHPMDIDVVTFVSHEDYIALEKFIEPLSQPQVHLNYGKLVDAYIVPINTQSSSYWADLFETVTIRGLPQRQQKKGFIQLTI
jgi:hypothetical protein